MKTTNKILKWLVWVTNNEQKPKHEAEFDIVFFIVNTIVLILGTFYLIKSGNLEWLAFLIIEYSWALDNLRHNREY
jgi:hypothetical protein